MLIRPVLESELALLREISIRTFEEAFGAQNNPSDLELFFAESRSMERFREEFKDPNSYFFFAEVEGVVAGYIKVNYEGSQTEEFDESSLELERIYVDASFQGKGVGHAMIEHFEQIGRDARVEMIWLGVWKKNPKAIEFYQRHGYEVFGEHNYLLGTDLQSDYLMKKVLHPVK